MLKRMILAPAFLACLCLGASGLKAQVEHATNLPTPATAAPAATEEHAKEPQLLPDPSDSQTWLSALWVLIIFVILLAILYPTAWKGVLASLKAREERIRKDISDAEAVRTKAEATLRQYNEQLAAAEGKIRDMLNKAQTEGEQIAANIRAHAQQEGEEIKERANKDIEAARKQAVADLYEHAANLATTVAEKILRRNLNVDDQRELINRSLEQLQQVNKN